MNSISIKVKLTDNFRPCQVLRAELPEKVTDILVDYPITPYELAFIRTYMPNAKVRRAKKKQEYENQPDLQTAAAPSPLERAGVRSVTSANQITLSLIFGREYKFGDEYVRFRLKSRTPSPLERVGVRSGAETISINWGDGSPLETFTVNSNESDEYTVIQKSYEYSSRYNITITGDLSCFDCCANEIDLLDLSRNPTLKVLKCDYNNLESLDLTNNTQLQKVTLSDNKFSKTALNKLFKTMHSNNVAEQKIIETAYNPATEHCNYTIATNKGWEVKG